MVIVTRPRSGTTDVAARLDWTPLTATADEMTITAIASNN
jgi:hypothetical protein